MTFLEKYFFPMQNCEETLLKFCKFLNVEVTASSLKKDILEHPDYPSLLSISDVLNNYHIENVALKTELSKTGEYPTPFIIQVKGDSTPYASFGIIKEISEITDSIEWYNPEKHKTENIGFNELADRFTGYVLLAEKDENSVESNYHIKLREQNRKSFVNNLLIAVVPFITLAISILSLYSNGASALLPILYTIFSLCGAFTGVLLIMYEIDQYNPALQQICHAGKKTNCGAILGTKASKVFGISWATIGFTYFTGVLFVLLSTGIVNNDILFIAAWLNVLCLIYVPYSIMYQWKVVKQWCPLCMTVQAILILQFVVALVGNFHSVSTFNSIPVFSFIIFLLFFAFIFLAVEILVPALEKAKENKENKLALQRLKHNSQIFEALLNKQKQITESTDGLGITIDNPNAKHKLIKVCNPYCGPCAKAHPMIEDLLHSNGEVQLQMIFTATEEEDDMRARPVRHLLAIDESGNKENTKTALDDWYLADVKDYNVFASKYPMNGELEKQSDKVKAMREWCDKTDITFTPTFFINGYQLPEMYSVADLKYFLTV